MTFEIESISIGKGKQEWGAPKEEVFIIKLGKVVALEIANAKPFVADEDFVKQITK